jgi:hypothetical protein
LKLRKGIGIAECLILILVVGVTLGAIFTTLTWAVKNQSFTREDMACRELLFSWVQNFESLWPTRLHPRDDVSGAVRAVAGMMNGRWDSAKKMARIGPFDVKAEESRRVNGKMVLKITIRGGGGNGKILVNLERGYNSYSNETVSDDVV